MPTGRCSGSLALSGPALIRSLRHVEPVSNWAATFACCNVAHLLAARIVAAREDAPGSNTVARRES